ncbi:MAG: response regulator transcription factor [Chloroflexi bacterium]|nr:response regulator transcription factor [Chloroflexota bacterium]MBI3764771.1 response regulator transcription factor [Chloroflexota bacterium]
MRVLVADDHPLFRDGIVSLLKAAGLEVVGEAGDGAQAIAEARRLRPDVVLMDIQMPGVDGIEATRRLKAEVPEARVVMLTVSQEDADLFEALKAGAHGYLLKSLSSDEFLDLLEGLTRGEAPLPRSLAAKVIAGFARQPDENVPAADSLTDREVELLELIALGFSNKAIAQRLGISENTVKYHMKNILQKLHLHNRAEAAAYAVRAGLAEGTFGED